MDKTLRQLIVQVCQHPQQSLQRRLLMNRLLIHLQQLPLGQSSHPDYLDALNRTWEWVNRSLCEKFDPNSPNLQKRLTQWIDSYLYWRIRELYHSNSKSSGRLDIELFSGSSLSLIDSLPDRADFALTRSGLDGYIEQLERQQTQNIGEQLERYIQSDRENRLKSLHPKDYPQCNCQFLSQRLLLQYPPAKYTQLARELGINPQTLISHWKRKCLPLLQEIVQGLGYKPDF